jgi:hypothetical protein
VTSLRTSLFALALIGCGDNSRPVVGVCDPVVALEACPEASWECAWGRVWAARGDVTALGDVVASDGSPDSFLRAMFPAIGDKSIEDAPVELPAGATYQYPSFDPYVIPTPIDWRADPFASNTWRQYFQGLHLNFFRTEVDGDALAAALLIAWRDRALYEPSPPDFTWGDHAVAIRLTNVASFLDHYIATNDVLSREVLRAGAEVILTHLYMFGAEPCYTAGHNHGMIQDIAVLQHARKYTAMRDGQAIWELAQSRAMIQAQHGVSVDGLHVENTSSYHYFFLTLVNRAIEAQQSAGVVVPEELVAIRDSMFEPLVQQIQPDGSYAQFGDAAEVDVQRDLQLLFEDSAALGVGDPVARASLEWMATGGASGIMPATDVVYEHSGYAVFRDRWSADAASVHFKTGHLSYGHYRPDETAFELFAHGRELVIQPGIHSYVADDPFYAYQMSPAAQNVLVVDGDIQLSGPTESSRVVAHGTDGDAIWVQGTHENFQHLGVGVVRTLVFAKPDVVIVVDHVRARGDHAYVQHFHLHPSLDQLVPVNERSVVAGATDGPALTLAAGFSPTTIHTDRGVADGSVRKGWYFPSFRVSEPAYDVAFESRGGDADLAVILAVAAPGQPAREIAEVVVESDGARVTVGWTEHGARRQVSFPAVL